MALLSLSSKQRLWLLFFFFALLFTGLGLRLGYLQVVRADYYEAVAESQRKRAGELLPHRGTIYASEGRSTVAETFPLATNHKAWLVYAIPRDMENPQTVADELTPALLTFRQRQRQRLTDILQKTGQQETGDAEPASTPTPDEHDILRQQLYDKFNQKTDPYEPLLRPYEVLDDELKSFLEDKKLPGVVIEEQEVRTYPEKTLAAHILGYVGYQEQGRVGRYGVEGFFEDILAGDFGFLASERDTTGKYIGTGSREFRPAQDGSDVILTIDRVVQSFIEEELKQGVNKFGAERGSILVMDPKTGAVLGMATYPTFDPNYYHAIRAPEVQLNPLVSEIFEPGSILKPLIMAAAIEEKKVSPETTFVDSGPVRVAEYKIDTFDGKHHGRQTMTQVLEQSNNVGMVWVAQQMGAEMMYDYFRRFGLGEKTGVELEGETQNQLPPPNKWNITTVATTSFGQGVALTPLQALNGINALANQGQLTQPHIVARIRHASGEEEITTPTAVRQVVSSQTAQKISAMMVSVIENGVATLAQVPGYYLAGKTGTAQVPDERGKYSLDRKIISFVGFGPVENPQFSILIKLDNPSGLSFASGTAAPMFRSVAEKLLKYYQIPPSYDPAVKPKFQVSDTNNTGT
ncbi:MAG: penicillin-binding protein 2 [Candidatus Andersenbacteria bacterium]